MNRIELIQRLIDTNDYETYLEIGAQKGASFLPVRSKNKIAVDPYFQIPMKSKLLWWYKNPANRNAAFYEQTSDDFFAQKSNMLKQKGVDIALVDGLHTYKMSLSDTLNCLQYLNDGGCIILHDCYPPTEASALPLDNYPVGKDTRINGWNNTWCGDVWKTMVYLRKKFPDALWTSVLHYDYGLGIVKVKSKIPEEDLQIDRALFEEVKQLKYSDMVSQRETWIGLKGLEDLDGILNELKN